MDQGAREQCYLDHFLRFVSFLISTHLYHEHFFTSACNSSQGHYEVFANETSLVATQMKSTKVTCDAELTF